MDNIEQKNQDEGSTVSSGAGISVSPPLSHHQADFQLPPVFRPTSAMAVWSLVNGILGWLLCPGFCSMIAVVTGHMALNEIRRLDLDGKGLAITGLVLGYSLLALVLLLILGIVMAAVFFSAFGA